MKLIIPILALPLFGLMTLTSCTKSTETHHSEIIYIGTFADEGLFVFEFNRADATFNLIQQLDSRGEPSFQAIHPNKKSLYSVSSEASADDADNGSVAAYAIESATGKLTLINEFSSAGRDACHVSVHPSGKFLYVSNYSSGNLSVFSIREDGGIGEMIQLIQHEGSSINTRRQNGPHTHSAIPSADGKYLYISDLGADRVYIYAIDADTGLLSPSEQFYVEATAGGGPRHLTMNGAQDFLYSLEELTGHVAVYSRDAESGALSLVQRVETLPDDFEGNNTSADIHFSVDGRYLYASNRGHDSIAGFEVDAINGQLTKIGHFATGGGHPRNFMVDPLGEFVFVANRDGNHIRVFKSGENGDEGGKLNMLESEVSVPLPVCITYFKTN
jgi:6-phosphogluconolactonase